MTHLVPAGSPDNRFKAHGIVLMPYEVRGPSSDDQPEGPLLGTLWAVMDGGSLWGQGPLTSELSALQYALKVQRDDLAGEMNRLVTTENDAIRGELTLSKEQWEAARIEKWLIDSPPEPTAKVRSPIKGP